MTSASPSDSADSAARESLTHGFLFADLRGYTAWAEARGDVAAADLLDRYRLLVRGVISEFRGAEIRTEGDSFYVVFPSASRAVAAGLAIVARAAEQSRADPTGSIRVGVGVHAGEAEERAEGYVGTAVNIAARVCSQAAAGEVLVTETVRVLAGTSGRYRFASRGRRSLKGITGPVALFAAEDAAAAPARAAVSGRATLRPQTAGALGIAAVAVAALLVVGAFALGLGRGSTTPSPPAAGGASVSVSSSMAGPQASASIGAPGLDDGSIAFTRARTPAKPSDPGGSHIYVVNPDGTGEVRLSPEFADNGSDIADGQPAWSPDGSTIAFSRNGQIWVMAADGADPRSLTNFGANAEGGEGAGHPEWSRDGKAIAFSVDEFEVIPISNGTQIVGTGARVYSIAASGTDLQVLTDAPRLFDRDPSWSPDGKRIVFTRADGEAHDGDLYTIDPAGGEPKQLTTGGKDRDPVWSPQGDQIAFARVEGDASDVYVVDPLGDRLGNLTNHAAFDRAPAWSPDGQMLAFVSDREFQSRIYLMEASGSGVRPVTTPSEGERDYEPAWGPPTP